MNCVYKLLWIFTFALSSTTFASPHGFYLAGKVGVFQADFNNTYLDRTDVIPLNIAQLSSQRGYTGGIAIGYSQDFATQYIFGGELSINSDGNKASFQSGASTTAFSDAIQIRHHTDLVFVSGIKITECFSTYLKLGVSLASLQDNLTSPVGFTAISANFNSTKNVFGFAAGIGAIKSITDQISIFTEANYHDYGSINWPNFVNFSANYTHKAHIYSYDVVVGTAYRFA